MATQLTPIEMNALELEYTQGQTAYANVETLYNILQDGGNTTGELLDITTAQPGDMWELRAQLLGDSPHLSMDVLKAAADKTNVLPESTIFDIMLANPDELRKDELISYLENKENPLPDYMTGILEEVANGVTYKTVLLRQLSDYNREKTRAAYDMIRSKVHDTLRDFEGLRNWLDNVGGKQADEQIIASWLQEGNTTDVLALAQMMPQFYGFEGKELLEHGYYMDLLDLHINLKQQNRNMFMLENDEIEFLETLADSSSGTAGTQARAILEFAYGYHYPHCIECNDSSGMKSHQIEGESVARLYGIEINAQPNPANGWTEFSYILPDENAKAEIHIYDVPGRLVDNIDVFGKQGHKLWDTRKIKPGLYFYVLQVGNISATGKIVISK